MPMMTMTTTMRHWLRLRATLPPPLLLPLPSLPLSLPLLLLFVKLMAPAPRSPQEGGHVAVMMMMMTTMMMTTMMMMMTTMMTTTTMTAETSRKEVKHLPLLPLTLTLLSALFRPLLLPLLLSLLFLYLPLMAHLCPKVAMIMTMIMMEGEVKKVTATLLRQAIISSSTRRSHPPRHQYQCPLLPVSSREAPQRPCQGLAVTGPLTVTWAIRWWCSFSFG